MSTKQRFAELSERIDELHFRFVPPLDPTGSYSEADHDAMSAFRLLVHAEIERFIEFLIEDALVRFTSKIILWKNSGYSSQLVDSLVNHTDKNLRQAIKANNGVKSKNILELIKPIGLTGLNLDNIWLQTMDDYGKVRGGLAHNSRRSINPIDPQTEQNLVYEHILPELHKLEILINSVN
jgi:hypothetical protein